MPWAGRCLAFAIAARCLGQAAIAAARREPPPMRLPKPRRGTPYGELNIGWNGLAAAPEYAGRRATRRMRLRTTWRLTAGCRFVCVGCAVALSLVGAATAVRWMLSVTSPSAAVAGAGTLDAGGGTAAGTESAIAPGRAAFPFGGSLRALPVSRLSSLSGASDFAITGGPIAPGMVRSAPPAEWRCHALDAKGAAAEARSSEAPES